MGTGVSLLGTHASKGPQLTISAGAGYGQLPVLYSEPTSYGVGNIHFDTHLLGNTRFYQELNVAGGKGAFQGRYDAGVMFGNPKTEFNAGVYASNDFNAPEFAAFDTNMENPTLTTKAPLRSGLLQAGITAGVKHHINKNVELFAKADLANLSYSKTGECIHPVKSKSDDYINNVHSCVIRDEYRYEQGIKSSVGAAIEGGAKVHFGNLTVSGKAGYSTFNGANYGVGLTYNCNILK